MANNFCMKCGTELPDSANFCFKCGAGQTVEDTVPPEKEATEPTASAFAPAQEAIKINRQARRKKRMWIVKLVRNAVIAALALTMLILLCFPIVRFDIEDIFAAEWGTEFYQMVDNAEELYCDINMIELVTIAADSLHSYSEEELQESDLYLQYTEATEQCMKELERNIDVSKEKIYVSSRAGQLCDRMMVLYFRCMVQSENTARSPALIAAAVSAVLCFLLLSAVLVLSVLNLLSCFHCGKRFAAPKLFGALVSLITAVPVAVPALFYSCKAWSGWMSMSWTLLILLILSVVTILFLIVYHAIWKQYRQPIRYLSKIFACAVVIAVMGLTFVPFVSSYISATFENVTSEREIRVPLNADFFDGMMIAETREADIDAIAEMGRKKLQRMLNVENGFSAYSTAEMRKGLADSDHLAWTQILLAVSGSGVDLCTLFSLLPVCNLMILIFAGLILQQQLKHLIVGRHSKAVINISRSLAVLFAVTALSIAIVFVCMIRYYVQLVGLNGYRLTLHAGLVVMAVATVVTALFPHNLGSGKKLFEPFVEEDRTVNASES